MTMKIYVWSYTCLTKYTINYASELHVSVLRAARGCHSLVNIFLQVNMHGNIRFTKQKNNRQADSNPPRTVVHLSLHIEMLINQGIV